MLQLAAQTKLETFIVAPGVAPAPIDPFHDPKRIPDALQNPATAPVQIYHLGLWFNNPQDVVKAGGPGTVTPFNGEHDAGVQVLNTGEFGDTQGPLKQVTTSGNLTKAKRSESISAGWQLVGRAQERTFPPARGICRLYKSCTKPGTLRRESHCSGVDDLNGIHYTSLK